MTRTIPAGVQPSLSAVGCSPAKINLTLEVLGRRPDGFHDLRSLVVGTGWTDCLQIEATTDGRIDLACDSNDLPTDERNLVVQAAVQLRDAIGADQLGAHCRLQKRIPLASGLGGGSSNAATALSLLNQIWNAGKSPEELARIGQHIGSDVPLFFSLPSCLISGRGERVEPWSMSWSGWAVICWAAGAVRTAAVYAQWRPEDVGARRAGVADATSVAGAPNARSVAALCFNDLEPAVFHVVPSVRALWSAVGDAAGLEPRVSGAGRAVYVLYDERVEADRLCEQLNAQGTGQGSAVAPVPADPSTTCEDDR